MGIRLLRGAKPPSSPTPAISVDRAATLEAGKPSAADLDAVAAEETAKAATAAPLAPEPAPSFKKAVPGGPTNPSYDADKFDSTGKGEKEDGALGPRGINRPADVMSDEERAAIVTKNEQRLSKGMSDTHSVDSVGKPKGSFAVVPQGHDKHGMRLPDKIDYTQPVEEHSPVHGPRGAGAPKDTFHKV